MDTTRNIWLRCSLRLPTATNDRSSIVDDLPQAAENFELTTIQSSLDFMVNGEPIYLWDPIYNPNEDNLVVGIGSQQQQWVRTNRELLIGNLGGTSVQPSEPLARLPARELLIENHEAPLEHDDTVAWVQQALADLEPLQELIAFKNLEDNSRVYLANPDGTALDPVLNYVGCPVFSPDGQHLAIRDGSNGVIVNVETFEELQRFSGSGKFSPDGRYFAFSRGADYPFQLVLFDLFDEQERVLVDSFGDWLSGDLDWSPDSSKIVYNQQDESHLEPDSVWAIDINTGEQRLILGSSDSDEFAPDELTWHLSNLEWYPNGEFIRFVHTTAMHIGPYTIVHADGSGFVAEGLEPEQEGYFSARAADDWSPDGTQIVYTNQDGASEFQLHIANVDGSNIRLLYRSEGYERFGVLWSPYGSSVAFERYDNTTGKISIWLINPDGSNAHELPFSDEHGLVAWSPDSSQLLTVDESSNIEILSLDARSPIHIGVGVCPSWSPSNIAPSIDSASEPSDSASQLELSQRILLYRQGAQEIWLRSTPDADDVNYSVVPSATIAIVIALPSESDSNQDWVEVETIPDAISGWVELSQTKPLNSYSEGYFNEICPNAAGYHFQIGQRFVVAIGDGATGIYTEPNTEPKLGEIPEGTGGYILDGPICKEGRDGNLLTWYVQTDSGLEGWVAEGYPDAVFPWIIPVEGEFQP
jgi:Tol biopolymer transport system component